MKYCLYLLLLLFIISCKPKTAHPNWKERSIKLTKNLGTVHIKLIPDFDTLHDWGNFTDYTCGAKQMYRYQSKQYPIKEESGFIKHYPDSFFSLTISHVWRLKCDSNSKGTFDADSDLKQCIQDLIEINPQFYRHLKFKICKKITINGLDFAVISPFKYNWDTLPNNSLLAFTCYHKVMIDFTFIKTGKSPYRGDFVSDAYDMLKTVRIERD